MPCSLSSQAACETVERHCLSALLKRSSHGEFLVPIDALKSTPASSLVPLLGSSLIGSLPSVREIFQSDRGFPWGEWGGEERGEKINYSL